ncbi:hypothetical protein BD289DRAFT_139939 [Coniella lustricola]|uniref:Uncharacterized protein n=1 Tax=Coniella lustricola TaxID=2025994 RepID=A0A2T3AF63_9PEZI|nr:hypothetical protein BD289DRAFT_139939 [Coniella lustricola]
MALCFPAAPRLLAQLTVSDPDAAVEVHSTRYNLPRCCCFLSFSYCCNSTRDFLCNGYDLYLGVKSKLLGRSEGHVLSIHVQGNSSIDREFRQV